MCCGAADPGNRMLAELLQKRPPTVVLLVSRNPFLENMQDMQIFSLLRQTFSK